MVRRSSVRRNRAQNEVSANQYESLESRRMFAFMSVFDGTTLEITQTADDGVVTIDNNGPGGEFQVSDFAGTSTFGPVADNVVVNLLDGSDAVGVQLDNVHEGGLAINMGNGNRLLSFFGSENSIGGDLQISAEGGQQILDLTSTNPLDVGGNLRIDTGVLEDTWFANELVTVGQDVVVQNLDAIQINEGLVTNDVTVNNSNHFFENVFELRSGSNNVELTGDLTYFGNNDPDQIELSDVVVDGAVNFSLGDGFTAGAENQRFFVEGTNHFGSLNVESGDTTNIDSVVITFASSTTIAGDLNVDVGAGLNSVFLRLSSIDGDVLYSGGDDMDSFQLFVDSAGDSNYQAELFGGNDNVELNVFESLSHVFIDYGEGNGFFSSSEERLSFDAEIVSLNNWDFDYLADSSTLTATESTATAGPLSVFPNPVSQVYQIDGQGISQADNLNINLSDDSTADLAFGNDAVTEVNLNIDLGNTSRGLFFNGGFNDFVGDVNIVGGAGEQRVTLDVLAGFSTTGDLHIDLGAGNDEISNLHEVIEILGDLHVVNTNSLVEFGQLNVGGDFVFDVSSESEDSLLAIEGVLSVGGELVFRGGLGQDEFRLNGAPVKSVSGNLRVDLGGNQTGGFQFATLDSGVTIAGNFKVESNVDASTDNVVTDPATFIGGNTYIDLGDGTNLTTLQHVAGSESLRYFGGDGNNTLLISTTGSAVDVFANFGAGDDTLELSSIAEYNEIVRADFAGGNDSFSYFGPFTTDVSLFDYNGFTSFYTVENDGLAIRQRVDAGDVLIDNNGIDEAIRLSHDGGGFEEFTPVTNLRYHAKAEANSDLILELDEVLSGDLNLKLRRGNRDVHFTGAANEIQGDLRIGGSNGRQHLALAVNSDLDVGGNLFVNLRSEDDTIDDGGHEIDVVGNATIRNINEYVVTNTLGVEGNLYVNTTSEAEDSFLINQGKVDVLGDLIYQGGLAADNLLLESTTTIGGSMYVHLGGNGSLGNEQSVFLSSDTIIGNQLNVISGATGVNTKFTSNPGAMIAGNVYVNFQETSGNNLVDIGGRFDGTHGAYRGGAGSDDVRLGIRALDMVFAGLFNQGQDDLEINFDTVLLSGFLDFGEGDDTFVDDSTAELDLDVVNL